MLADLGGWGLMCFRFVLPVVDFLEVGVLRVVVGCVVRVGVAYCFGLSPGLGIAGFVGLGWMWYR